MCVGLSVLKVSYILQFFDKKVNFNIIGLITGKKLQNMVKYAS